jgi:ABC-2 type transport system ATP-binding protein
MNKLAQPTADITETRPQLAAVAAARPAADMSSTQPIAAAKPQPSAHPAWTAPPGDLVVQATDLTKKFNNEAAVLDMNLDVPRGTIFGLIGPSGCGKTTSVRLMTGIYLPTSGRITVLGTSPEHFSAHTRKRLGYMPQQFVLYPNLSIWENLNFSASLYGMGFRRGQRLKELLEFVELYPHRNKLARSISGGMLRRLALAATLAHDPTMIFLDEPTAGIDPVLRHKFWDYFKALKAGGRTLVITTQYVGEAENCDLVAVMAAGRVVMLDTPDGLRWRAFGGEMVDLQAAGVIDQAIVTELRALPYIGRIQFLNDATLRLIVSDAGTVVPALVEWARARSFPIRSVEKYVPPLDDAFVEIVKGVPGGD